jgi:PIN domain nuclease of toxin-antitoxin system
VIALDTHALLWWVSGDDHLSAKAARAIRQALRKGQVVASAISIFEIATAVRRGRYGLSRPLDPWLDDVRALPELRIEPVTEEIARLAGSWSDAFPGDPADRIIAATALVLGTSLVTADPRIAASRVVRTVW